MATAKQRRALAKAAENGGNISAAMRAVGYSPATAKTPQKLTESKGWKELVDEYLPDDKLAKVHSEGLEANKIISANITYGDADEKTNDFIEVPDHATRHKFLESAYKLKGRSLSDTDKLGGTSITNFTQIIINPPHAKNTGDQPRT
jgi:hypothetical protein